MILRLFPVMSVFMFTVLFSACGPVQHKTYSSPSTMAQQTMLEQGKRARLTVFVFNETSKDCRNSIGMLGYNVEVGPCSLITDAKQLIDKTYTDLHGSMFYRFTLPEGTQFEHYNLEDTTWVSVKGSKIDFKDAQMDRAQFTNCDISKP